MKRRLAVLLSALLLMVSVLPVSADVNYNDDEFDWGDLACSHGNSIVVEAVASTCTTQGHGAYTKCLDCKLVIIGSSDPLPLAPHTYDGDRDATCNDCDYVRTLLGDADGNGRVNNRDLGLLLRYLNQWSVTLQEDAVDLDGNGRINNQDLGLLQRILNQ